MPNPFLFCFFLAFFFGFFFAGMDRRVGGDNFGIKQASGKPFGIEEASRGGSRELLLLSLFGFSFCSGSGQRNDKRGVESAHTPLHDFS